MSTELIFFLICVNNAIWAIIYIHCRDRLSRYRWESKQFDNQKAWFRYEVDCAKKGNPFAPPLRTVGGWIIPPPPTLNRKSEMDQKLFDSMELEILKIRGNEAIKHFLLKQLKRNYPQFQ